MKIIASALAAMAVLATPAASESAAFRSAVEAAFRQVSECRAADQAEMDEAAKAACARALAILEFGPGIGPPDLERHAACIGERDRTNRTSMTCRDRIEKVEDARSRAAAVVRSLR